MSPTPAQWLLSRLHQRLADRAVLNMSYALALEGAVDRDALAGALRVVSERHAPISAPVQLEVLASKTEPLAAWLADEDAARPFDLAAPPLARAALVETNQRNVLLLSFHHLCADGWALDVFSRELSAAYAALRSGAAPSLPPLPEVEEPASEPSQATPAVAAVPAPERAWRKVLPLPAPLAEAARACARERRVSLFMLLATALAAALGRYTNARNVALGTLTAGRSARGSTRVMGAYYDTAVLELEVAEDACLQELLAEVAAQVAERLERPGRSPIDGWRRGVPPPNVRYLLFMDRHPLERLRLDGAAVSPLHVEPAFREVDERLAVESVPTMMSGDAALFVREGAGPPTLSLFYAEDALDHEDAAELLELFLAALDRLVAEPTAPLSSLPSRGDAPAEARVELSRRGAPALRALGPIHPAAVLSPAMTARVAALLRGGRT